MNRNLAHSYLDELPPVREPIEPIIQGWGDALRIIRDVLLVLAGGTMFFLGLLAIAQPGGPI